MVPRSSRLRKLSRMVNRQFTQAAVAIIGMTGLVIATLISLVAPELEDARNLLLGGLIASTSTAAAWLFRLNGRNGGHTP